LQLTGFILENRLVSFNNNDLGNSSSELLKMQKESWEQCSNGYRSLDTVQTKEFEFDGFNIYVQFNPGRIISTSAKVDAESIKERRCFLCLDNLPSDQKGILYKENYIILCNPFPIFPEHFTIPSIKHKPQSIPGYFYDFLMISKDLSEKYLVFYNGPKCGASAPDHFHFQAGTKEFLPLVKDYTTYKKKFGRGIYSDNNIEISHLDDGLRRLFIIEGDSPRKIEAAFMNFYRIPDQVTVSGEEPMMNILCFYEDGLWKVIIILREKHRPSYFFAEGDKNIMISPAAVDLGGVCITPLEKDFSKITKDDLSRIFDEVILDDEKFNKLISGFRI
jgi:hypothetical protein